jgi:hypothetical protein
MKKKKKQQQTKKKQNGPTRPAHTVHGGVRRAVTADLVGV